MEIIRGPFNNLKEIILASASPRRQYLLSLLGIHFEVKESHVREIEKGHMPHDLAILNARNKAEYILRTRYRGVIIGADTIVVFKGKILGKPRDKEDAYFTLKRLSGNWHEVITGCYIIDNSNESKQIEQFFVNSMVFLDKMDDDIIRKYIETKEPMDKAGSYAVQGVGSFFVKEIKGSYTNVIGLPLNEVVTSLLRLKAITV